MNTASLGSRHPGGRLLAAAVGLVIGLAGAGQALADASPDAQYWNLSGFGTAGVTYQRGAEGWGFMRENGQPGASRDFSAGQDSRVGLQLNWSDRARWEAFAQGIWSRRPADTPLAERIEWAYVGYRPTSDTSIRLGRANPDNFLYSDVRNVGYAQTWARLPVDFYGFQPVSALDGIHLQQQWQTSAALWRARAAFGRFSTSSSSVFDQSRFELTGRRTLTLSLSGEAEGLLVKLSYARMRMEMDLGASVRQLQDALGQIGQLPVPGLADSMRELQQGLWTQGSVTYAGLGLQYDRGPWTLVAEGSDIKVDGSLLPSRRGYLSLAYRFPGLTVYGTASRSVAKKDPARAPDLVSTLTPVIGPQGAQQAQMLASYAATGANLYRFDQSTIGAGLRWDVTPQTALKFQVDRFKVHAAGAASWRGGTDRPDRATVFTLLLDFVWGS